MVMSAKRLRTSKNRLLRGLLRLCSATKPSNSQRARAESATLPVPCGAHIGHPGSPANELPDKIRSDRNRAREAHVR